MKGQISLGLPKLTQDQTVNFKQSKAKPPPLLQPKTLPVSSKTSYKEHFTSGWCCSGY
jgi:hypothetical protein